MRFALMPEGPWQTVVLPDTWARRGIAAGRIGHYRATVMLPAVPASVWALRLDRLSVLHEVRLNGRLVHGSLGLTDVLRRPVPTLITVPPDLWVAGENQLDIAVDSGPRAGLSPIDIGPEPALSAGFLWSHHRTATLPQVLNSAAAGISAFMLMVWWRRRQETALGCFGLLSLLASLRNLGYFQVGSFVSAAVMDGLFFVLQVVTVSLLGFFSMAFSGRWPTLYRRGLQVLVGTAPVVAVLAAATGQLHHARTWLYPVLALVGLTGLGLIVRSARQRRSRMDGALVVALGAVIAVGMHDYLFQQGHTSVMDAFWLPYALPLFTAVFSTALLRRVVDALATVEHLNVTLEHRVAERTRELQDANQAKTRFLAAASHDLRQPMVGIGLLVGLLREQPHAPAVARVVSRLHQAVLGMEDLFNRLLDLSRLESGTVRVRRQALPLQALFDAIEAHQREPARSKGLDLRLRPCAWRVDSDPLLLEQILRNLVANAVRYTLQGGVLVAARRDGPGHVRLEVRDTGPGIPLEQQALIFAEFVQLAPAAPTRHDPAGLGLGLSIAQRSADLLGTTIALRSRPGRGSCFSVRVPLAAAEVSMTAPPTRSRVKAGSVPVTAPTAADAEAAVRPGDPCAWLAGRTLWLLEDHPEAREALRSLLTQWGARVEAFGTVHALLEQAGPTTAPGPAPDLIITDQHLPDGQGSQALAALRERWPDLPGVVVTGDTAPGALALLEAVAQAGTPVLHKPFEAPALRAAIDAICPAPRSRA